MGGTTFGKIPIARVTSRIEQAIADGAAAVNVSLGFNWHESFGRKPLSVPDSVSIDTLIATAVHRELRGVLERFAPGDLPLLVLAAGNDAVDAKWAGFPQVAQDFPDNVIVVGSSTFENTRTPSSNDGALVDLLAPGNGVFALDGIGTVDTVFGTSYSAPYVTGVAGLLRSFDSNLPLDRLKHYIVEGARRGGRTAGGVPILNAYESLRAAAERPGAPLCGNEVWAADGQLYARRTSTLVEPLASLVSEPVAQVEVLHGGKNLLYLSLNDGGKTLAWNSDGSWTEAPLPSDYAQRRGGTRNSVFGYSHGQDSLAFVDASVVSGTRWFETSSTEEAPVIVRNADGVDQEIARILVEDSLGPVQRTCIESDRATGSCVLTIIEDRTWRFRLAYPQIDSRAYVTVSPMHHIEIGSTAWAPCSFDSSHDCRQIQTLQAQQGSKFYSVDLQDGGIASVASIPQDIVFWVGQGETGNQLVLARGEWTITFWADAAAYYLTGSPFYGVQQQLDHCTIDYRERDSFEVSDSIPTTYGCDFGSAASPSTGAGGATIAASRIAGSGGNPARGTVEHPAVLRAQFFGFDRFSIGRSVP